MELHYGLDPGDRPLGVPRLELELDQIQADPESVEGVEGRKKTWV
jgi:hypothetical protein